MKNNFTISQRNAIVENHLWCIKAVMKQNRALIRAAKLDTDDVYQELALRLIRAGRSTRTITPPSTRTTRRFWTA